MNTLKYVNSICILLVCSILIGALYFQFVLHEEPCPLCLLQRLGMFGVIFGLSLNSHFGFKAQHFGITIIAALIGGMFSTRQVLLHICPSPDDLGYGTPVFGLHLYTWGVVIFVASILGSALFLLFSDTFKKSKIGIIPFEKFTFYLAVVLLLINVVATFFECQLGPCCEDGPCI